MMLFFSLQSDVPVESTHMHVFTLNNLMPRLHSQSRENFSQIMGKKIKLSDKIYFSLR